METRRTNPEERAHTVAGALWFAVRAAIFRMARTGREVGRRPVRWRASEAIAGDVEIARSVSTLYSSEGITPRERGWQLGKVENLRIALRRINGVRVPAGRVFSFWRQIGPPWSARGFVVGRELREGCLIPNVGGGLCQLSNALFDCALKAGLEIVERHAHTRIVRGSLAELNRDATVFWNYVDLRFRAAEDIWIMAELTCDALIVSIRARHGMGVQSERTGFARAAAIAPVETCATCGIESCLRHTGPGEAGDEETAVLADEFRPEFDAWLGGEDRRRWHLVVPMRFSRWRRGNYAWREAGWGSVRDAAGTALRRSWQSRKLAAQGAARQRALLDFDRRMALALSAKAPWRCSRAVVAQTLLPHLHESGWLGGRSYAVMMTRWPIRLLQERLDAAAARHPESQTLADFRAHEGVAEREWRALERAERIVTCHARLAEVWPEKSMLLPWDFGGAGNRGGTKSMPGGTVVFPASGLGCKGVYELREAMRRTELALRVLGAEQLEGNSDFWDGVRLAPSGGDWRRDVAVVVLPAWVEHQPRRLIEAIRAGIPVVATDACGLHGLPAGAAVSIVKCGDVEALAREIVRWTAVELTPPPASVAAGSAP
jgi:hypothetical protein